MKLKFMLIGLALVLMLCISPVAAVSGTDFEIKVNVNYGSKDYKYFNVNDSFEEYIKIYIKGTKWLNSKVTFNPVNIPDAPVMDVPSTSVYRRYIYLPGSVDDWEINYYSTAKPMIPPSERKYLKNSCTVNLKKEFGEFISQGKWLYIELSKDQYICPWEHSEPKYNIPDVD